MTASGMARIARWSIAHRWLVVAGGVLLAVVGGLTAARSGSRLSFTFDLPGQPAYQTNTAIVHTFGFGGNEPPLVAVVRLPQGVTVQSPGVREQLTRAFGKAAAAAPGARTASWVSTGDRAFVSADGRTTFELIYPVASITSANPYATALPRLDKALASQHVHGAPVRITSATILSSGGRGAGQRLLVETLLAGLGALVVLAIVFGSFIAITPLIIAAVAIPTAFAFIFALTYLTTMSTLVQNIVALVGLGVAIDYALLIVTRWREERGNGRGNRAAVLRASATAGRSVLFSGITVAVSLAALALTTVPFLRSIGLAGMLIPLISIGVSATLLPVILDWIGPRPEWPRRKPPDHQPAVDQHRARRRRSPGLVGHRGGSGPGRAHRPGLLAQPRRATGRRHRCHRARRRPCGPGRSHFIRHRPGRAPPHRDPAPRAQHRTAARNAYHRRDAQRLVPGRAPGGRRLVTGGPIDRRRQERAQ